MKLIFSDEAWDDYLYWQKQDRKMVERINKLIQEVKREPFSVRISAIVDGCFSLIVHGETASARKRWEGAQAPGWNVAQSSTISLKRAV